MSGITFTSSVVFCPVLLVLLMLAFLKMETTFHTLSEQGHSEDVVKLPQRELKGEEEETAGEVNRMQRPCQKI